MTPGRDLFGRPVLSAQELDAMTPEQRQAAFDTAVVTELNALPTAFLEQARRDAETAAARATARRACRSGACTAGSASRAS